MSSHLDPVCVYHKDCSDGTAAAAVFLHKFPNAKTFPVAHGYTKKDAEDILTEIPSDSFVYTIDCVLLVKECLEKGHTVVSLDHHIGVYEEMTESAREQSNYTYIFNNELSGATLAWTHFFQNQEIPHWLILVEDKDLYKNKYKDSTYFMNWSYMQINCPEKLLFLFESRENLSGPLSEGAAIDNCNQFYVDSFTSKAKPLYIKYKTNYIPAYNSTYLQSALGGLLTDSVLGVSIIFSIKGSSVRMSIRSQNDSQISALEVAQSFGGGGHRNAAGCEMQLFDFIYVIEKDKN